jgi:PAS domain S-box-containing protein
MAPPRKAHVPGHVSHAAAVLREGWVTKVHMEGGGGRTTQDLTIRRENRRLLMVGDDPAWAELIGSLLAETEFELEHVAGLSIALERLTKGGFALVLLDLGLPDSDGIDTLRRVHAHSPELPVVVLGHHEDNELAARLVQEGVQDFLVKEHTNGLALGCILRRAIQRKRAEVAIRASAATWWALLDATGEAAFLMDTEGIVLALNETAAQQLGGSVDELLGACIWDFTSPEMAAIRKTRVEDVIRLAKPVRFEDEHAKLWFDNSIYPILDMMSNVTSLAVYAHDITKRKRTDQELMTLARFPSENPNPVLRLGGDGTLLYANAASQPLLNHWGCSVGQCVPEFGCKLVADALASQRGTTFDIECGERAFTFTVIPVVDAGYVNLYGGDITERKRAEAYHETCRQVLQILNEPGDLRNSIQRILATLKTRTGFDAVGIRLQDGDDFPYYVQQGFSKDFLLTENTLVARAADGGVCRDKDGKVCLECTCGLVISGKTDPSNPLFTKGGSCWTNDSFPLLELPADQDPRLHPRNRCIHQGYASVALVPVRNKDRIVGLIQFNDRRKGRFSRDTIEVMERIASHIGEALMRKQAEDDVRFQKILLESQNEASIDGILNVDANEKMIWFNRRFLEMWAIPEEVVQSHSDEAALQSVLDKLVHPQAFIEKAMYLHEHKDLKSREEIRLKDGRVFDRYSSPVVDADGTYLGRVWLFRDITARKRTEEELQGTLADLTRAHEDLKVSQLQLIQLAKMQSVGQLAAGVAHEVKNPLAIALMGVEYLSGTLDTRDGQTAMVLNDTKEAILRADNIVRELLRFSTPSKLDLNLEDLNGIVAHTLNSAMYEARKRHISIQTELGEGLPHLQLDRGKIEQTLLNLCMNGIEAMPEGGTLLIRTRANQLQTGATEVILEVEDTGPGIADEDLARIFDPFFTKKGVGEGTGLGLTVARQILDLHGGTLRISNRVEGGAKASITLKT